jgi:hypothetical protein
MRHEVFQAILDKLTSDGVLTSRLGGAYVYRRQTNRVGRIPSVTLAENTESSTPRVGYRVTRKRDNSPILQVDIWVSGDDESSPNSGEDADLIAERVDELLLDASSPLTGTGQWARTTSSQQFEEDTRIWHNALRYTFQYSITDN